MKMTIGYILCTVALFLVFPVKAQQLQRYPGDLNFYRQSVTEAVEKFYDMSFDCIMDDDMALIAIQGVTDTYMDKKFLGIPDFDKSFVNDGVYDFSHYVGRLAHCYKKYVGHSADLRNEISGLELSDAFWTEDNKGIIIQVAFNSTIKSGEKVLHSGRSSMLLVFPFLQNVYHYKYRQVAPDKWVAGIAARPSAKPAAVTAQSDNLSRKETDTGGGAKAVSIPESQQDGNKPDNSQSDKGSDQNEWYQPTSVLSAKLSGYRMPSDVSKAIKYLNNGDFELALPVFQKYAAQNDPYALGYLGYMYQWGFGVPIDNDKFKEYSESACRTGHPFGYCRMAWWLFRNNVGVNRLFGESMARQLHEIGFADGTDLLSTVYANDMSNPDALAKSFKLAQESARNGSAKGLFSLASCYFSGEGCTVDSAAFVEYTVKAFNAGFIEVYTLIIDEILEKQQPLTDMDLFNRCEKMARQVKDFSCYKTLGNIYSNKKYGVLDYDKALFYYLPIYNKGEYRTAYDIGQIYSNRRYRGYDLEKSYKFYKYSADNDNNAEACFKTFDNLKSGWGVQKNIESAHNYLIKAADLGHRLSISYCALYYYSGDPFKQDYKQAFKYAKMGVDRKDSNCLYVLGSCYLYGLGIDKDIAKGLALMEEASLQKNPGASYVLGMAYLQGRYNLKVDSVKAAHYFQLDDKIGAACCELAKLHHNGSIPGADQHKAYDLWLKAYGKGHAESGYWLGMAYLNGWGVEKKRSIAISYFRGSAVKGYKESEVMLQKLGIK